MCSACDLCFVYRTASLCVHCTPYLKLTDALSKVHGRSQNKNQTLYFVAL